MRSGFLWFRSAAWVDLRISNGARLIKSVRVTFITRSKNFATKLWNSGISIKNNPDRTKTGSCSGYIWTAGCIGTSSVLSAKGRKGRCSADRVWKIALSDAAFVIPIWKPLICTRIAASAFVSFDRQDWGCSDTAGCSNVTWTTSCFCAVRVVFEWDSGISQALLRNFWIW